MTEGPRPIERASLSGEELRRPRARSSVGRRLLFGYVALLVAFAITMTLGVRDLRVAAEESKLLRTGLVPLQLSVGQALAEQNILLTQLNHAASAKNPADVRAWIETQQRARPRTVAAIQKALDELEVGGPALVEMVRAARADLELMLARQDGEADPYAKLFDALATGNAERSSRLASELVRVESDNAARLRGIRERAEAAVARLDQEAVRRERRAVSLLVLLSVVTLVVGAAISLYARRALRPLRVVTERAQVVAGGDLTPREAFDDGSEIGELAGTFEQMVRAIRDARSQAVEAEKLAAIGKMAAHITHEIRNPLSALSLNLDLLESELAEAAQKPEESRELVQAIKAEVNRLARLSEQYLSLARRPRPKREAESLAELWSELAEFLGPEMRRANVKVELDVAPDVPEVLVDESLLRQAFLNLVRNAREAMQEGGTVWVRVETLGGAGGVRVTVDDDGPGIPEAVRASVFDPFFTTKQRGTGLGLAVTREIIEAHGGRITVSPREPKGTRFEMTFPAAKDVAASEPPPAVIED